MPVAEFSENLALRDVPRSATSEADAPSQPDVTDANKMEGSEKLDADRATLNNLELVSRCAIQLSNASEPDADPDFFARVIAQATEDLKALQERPEILEAFADAFSHPAMIAGRLESPTEANLEVASDVMRDVYRSLVDRSAAWEMHLAGDFFRPLKGPTPWDTFYVGADKPDQALMPLFGSRNDQVLSLGPIEGGGPLRSEGGLPLFYPVGGYERFESATSVVVAQNLADGLAIDAVMGAHNNCAVVVASSPEGVADLCVDLNQTLVARAAIARPGERGDPSLVAALTHAGAQESDAVKRLLLEGPRMGTDIVEPRALAGAAVASWPDMPREAIDSSVRSAQLVSNGRLEDAAEERDERLDHGSGFRESVRELREKVRDDSPALTADEPAKIEQEQTRAASRRM
jgi:hypothetical protein